MVDKINREDVSELKKRPSVRNKSQIAFKVGKLYEQEKLTPNNRLLAEGIFRILLHDAAIKVRETLADTLKNAKNLPADIVNDIIKDIDTVAIPFIQHYEDISDNDLIEILGVANIAKQKAIAKRKNLSAQVSSAIVDKCMPEVIESLLTNDSSHIDNKTFEQIISLYPQNDILKKGIVYRSDLPFEVIEKIINHISYKLKTYLVLNHNLPQDFTSDLINEIKEKLTLKISEEYSQDEQMRDFVQHLYKANRLTYSLVTRAICSGDLAFFEHSLSFLAETPVSSVRKILFNSQADFEIRNLLRKALLPKSVFSTILNAIKVINGIKFDCGRTNNHVFSRKVIERILSSTPLNDELSGEDLNYLISQIN